jgi:hypothetical protein
MSRAAISFLFHCNRQRTSAPLVSRTGAITRGTNPADGWVLGPPPEDDTVGRLVQKTENGNLYAVLDIFHGLSPARIPKEIENGHQNTAARY